MINPPERLLACEISEAGSFGLSELRENVEQIYTESNQEIKDQDKRLVMQKAPKGAGGRGQVKGIADIFPEDSFTI